MSPKIFDRDTLLDLTVNIIPLAIIGFFVAAFALVNPFGWDSIVSTLQFGILIVTGVSLTILTYVAGKAISEGEEELEARNDEATEEDHADADLEEEAPA